jgi:hypothetical protein
MIPYADQTLQALLIRYLDESVHNMESAVSIGAWTPSMIDEDVEDFELTDEHVKEWLMLVMNDVIEGYLEVKHGVHSDETQNR